MDQTVGSITAAVSQLLDAPAGAQKVARLRAHFDRLAACEPILREQVRRLGKRPGVAFYARVGSLTDTRLLVDVRISGTSCGELTVEPKKKERIFRPNNFEDIFPGKSAEWRTDKVKVYLAAAKEQIAKREREAAVEAALLVEMANDSSRTKPRVLLHHQPVMLAGLPFQFPLPIRARTRIELADGTGHADVLARARADSRLCLRVIEVKKVGAADLDHALDQAVAYCAALDYLVTRFPETYSTAFGFGRPRRQLPLDAVAFVPSTPQARQQVEGAARRLGQGGSRFGLCAQYFRWENGALVIENEERYA